MSRRTAITSSFLSYLFLIVTDQLFKHSLLAKILNPEGALGLNIFDLLVISCFIAVFVLWIFFLVKQKSLLLQYLMGAITFASLSNIWDRVTVGGVIDYIHLLGVWFNLSDIVIVISCIILSIYFIKH